ncbi:MAG: hypothetical protein IJI54_08195 [Kiritimatiellae bacterium]|nr:hypothetical protein [Kiritimatiellia bacterium]
MKNEELIINLKEKFRDCPEDIRKRIESMVDAGLLGEVETSLSDEEVVNQCAKVACLTENERKEIKVKIPKLDEVQNCLQKDYLRVLILLQDLKRTAENFDNAIKNGDWIEGLRELKVGLLAYYLSDDARQKLSRYGKDDTEICELSKKLAPRTTFLAHLRNHIAGHLDDVVLEKTCQWGGYCMFTKDAMSNPKLMILVNKFLVETGINCCIASKPADKNVIKDEIDLTYPPDYDYFMQFMNETYNLTVEFLSKVKAKIEKQLTPYGEKEAMLRAVWAGETDFTIG